MRVGISNTRNNNLDILRGLAAACVGLEHSLIIYNYNNYIQLLFGRLPVIIFFILSGYVLSASLENKNLVKREIVQYYIKRLFRLYPPIFFITIILYIFYFFYRNVNLEGTTPWFQQTIYSISHFHNIKYLFRELILRTTYYNIPLWSIRVEIICSIFFPILLYSLRKNPLPVYIISAFCIYKLIKCEEAGTLFEFNSSLYYVAFFVMGWVLFKRKFTDNNYIFLISLLFLIELNKYNVKFLNDLLLLPIASIIINNFTNIEKFKMLSGSRYLHALGKVSYSYYLLNFPITVGIYFVISSTIISRNISFFANSILIFTASLAITFVASILFYKFPENYFNQLGRKIATNVK